MAAFEAPSAMKCAVPTRVPDRREIATSLPGYNRPLRWPANLADSRLRARTCSSFRLLREPGWHLRALALANR